MNILPSKEDLFPAHAGVIPVPLSTKNAEVTFPRPRGGDPKKLIETEPIDIFSPPTRG